MNGYPAEVAVPLSHLKMHLLYCFLIDRAYIRIEVFKMNLIHDIPSVGSSNIGPRLSDARIPNRNLAEERRDHLVANGLLFTSLSGLLAVVAAICTTMIERRTIWRYSWLAACIVFALLMTAGIFTVCSTIGRQTPQHRTVPDRRP